MTRGGHMRAWARWLVLLLPLLAGCSGQDASGPVEVRWDRETCTRCAMTVSDRQSAAQVRGAPAGQPTRVYTFDDIGCAVIWLDGQPWKNDTGTEIWVTDHRTGEWLEARAATFITGQRSAMGYDLGAQREASAGAMDFARAKQYIYAVEAQQHAHRGQHRPAGPAGAP